MTDRGSRLDLSLGTLLVIGIAAIGTDPRTASAAPPVPVTTISRYMNTVNPDTWWRVGRDMGDADRVRTGTQNTVVIMAVGAQTSRGGDYGVSLFARRGFYSLSSLAQAVKQMGAAYWGATGTDTTSHLEIVVGTNNSGEETTAEQGKQFALMINAINQYFATEPHWAGSKYLSQVHAMGGNDMEMAWDTSTRTKSWAQGYNNWTNSWKLYNFGDCAGCPTGMVNGWTQFDVWYVSWGLTSAYSIPEIYNTNGKNATQWYRISLYGYTNQNGQRIGFDGPLTQYAACQQSGTQCTSPRCCTNNSATAGWQQLWDTINADSRTISNLRWSTDISHRDR